MYGLKSTIYLALISHHHLDYYYQASGFLVSYYERFPAQWIHHYLATIDNFSSPGFKGSNTLRSLQGTLYYPRRKSSSSNRVVLNTIKYINICCVTRLLSACLRNKDNPIPVICVLLRSSFSNRDRPSFIFINYPTNNIV
jgi:hypothetical protein